MIGGSGDTFAQEGKAGLQYPFNGLYPATSISTSLNGSYFVIGMPGVNNFIGSVVEYDYTGYNSETQTYVPFYNTLVPFGPPFPLPSYSMFGKQVCLSANGTLLYITAPSSDSLTSASTFDSVMSSVNEVAYSMTSNNGFPLSYLFLYTRNITNATGWSYSSYTVVNSDSITVSCSKLFNSTIYWNLNQNNNPIFNNFITPIPPINTTYIPLYPLPWNASYYQPITNPAPCPSNRTFYVSLKTGSDLNDGQSVDTPWQTISHVNNALGAINWFLPGKNINHVDRLDNRPRMMNTQLYLSVCMLCKGDQILFCRGDAHYKVQITITPNTASYASVNPFNCSLRFSSYRCVANISDLPQWIGPKFSYLLPSYAPYWVTYPWLSLNQTTYYPTYAYNLTKLQLDTGNTYVGEVGSSTNPALPSQIISTLKINGNVYNIATHPNVIKTTLGDGITVITGATINETFYADNTCGLLACPAANTNSPITFSGRWSPGSYCRLIIQALFNGNQTLANEILPTAFYSLTTCGTLGFEQAGCSSDPTSHFDIGTLNCSWFMSKYVHPVYAGLSMASPLIDNFALTYSDWSDTILPSITSSTVYGDFCNFVWGPGSDVYDYANVLQFSEVFPEPPGYFADFRPIPGTSETGITPNMSAFKTTYYGDSDRLRLTTK